MTVNQSKSTVVPTQSVDHLGFRLDIHRGVLMVPPAKLKSVRRELGKLVCHGTLSCRKMAAILGQVRSFLTAMPFLMAFTDKMLLFVRRHQFIGWDHPLEVPSELRQEVLDVNHLMMSWAGRVFQGQCTVRSLASDSSNLAWGGLDTSSGLSVQDYWREKSGLHINVKESDSWESF